MWYHVNMQERISIMNDINALVEMVLEQINAESTADSDMLSELATELAGGVTAERDAEIAEMLPGPYKMKVNASAEMAQSEDDMLTIPRVVYVTASQVDGGDWNTSSMYGKRQRAPKMDCAVGVATDLELENIRIMRLAILWRRAK